MDHTISPVVPATDKPIVMPRYTNTNVSQICANDLNASCVTCWASVEMLVEL